LLLKQEAQIIVRITIKTTIIAKIEVNPKIEDKTYTLLQYYIIQMYSAIYTNAIVILLKTTLVIKKLFKIKRMP
jgi:hypothetical protein